MRHFTHCLRPISPHSLSLSLLLPPPPQAMRNYFAMISVPLPMDKESPQARLQSCSAVTKELKASPLALLQLVSERLCIFAHLVFCIAFRRLIFFRFFFFFFFCFSLLAMPQLVQNKLLALAPDFLVKKTAHDVFSRHSMVSEPCFSFAELFSLC